MVFLFTKTVDEKFRWRTGLLDNDSEACAMKRNGRKQTSCLAHFAI